MELIKDVGYVFVNGYKRKFGLFNCPICGDDVQRRIDVGKRDISCGCKKGWANIKHGESGGKNKRSRLYLIWQGMKRRCSDKNHSGYKKYGDKGVIVCSEWKKSFINFKEWAVKNGYNDTLTIDRIDNSGNYEPGNCQFITMSSNSIKRKGVYLTYKKAEEIRSLYFSGGMTKTELSIKFKTSEWNIGSIVSGKNWKKDYHSENKDAVF